LEARSGVDGLRRHHALIDQMAVSGNLRALSVPLDAVERWLPGITVPVITDPAIEDCSVGLVVETSSDESLELRFELFGGRARFHVGSIDDLGVRLRVPAVELLCALALPEVAGTALAAATVLESEGRSFPGLPLTLPEGLLARLPAVPGASFALHLHIRNWIFGDVDAFLAVSDGEILAMGYGTPLKFDASVSSTTSCALEFMQGRLPIPDLLAAGAEVICPMPELSVIQGVLQSEEYLATWRDVPGVAKLAHNLAIFSDSPSGQDWRRRAFTASSGPLRDVLGSAAQLASE
jgi:hypothetical protein